MGNWEMVKVERIGEHVAEVVLNRPDKGNAFLPQTFEEVAGAFAELDADKSVRAIVFRGEGKAFSYGLDLAGAMSHLGPHLQGGLAGQRLELYEHIRTLQAHTAAPAICRKPVIAAVHGWCIGAGLDLISACDIRLCTADARFSLREARVAIVADIGSLQRLPKIIGDAATRELALTAKDIGAERAVQMGLVSQVAENEAQLLEMARAEAAQIATLSPLVVQGVKHVMNEHDGKTIAEGLEHVAVWNSAFLASTDLGEAITSFFEKRKPNYKGE